MVADSDRGQLLLVGAVLVAVVIVGVVVQFNSLQYTNTEGSQGESAAFDRAAETEAAVVDDVAYLARTTRDDEPSDFEAAFKRNVSTYDNYTQNMSATSGATYVNVTVNESASRGFRVEQNSGGTFDEPGAPSTTYDWALANETSHVQEFWVNTTSISGSNKFNLTVVSESGTSWWFTLESTGGTEVMEVYDGTSTSSCTLPSESVDINLVDGTVDGVPSCSFNPFTEELDPTYNISITKGNRAEGNYVFEAAGDLQPDESDFDSGESRIIVPAIDVEYRATDLAYNRTVLIEEGAP